MFLPPVLGTRKLVTVTTALLVLPLVGWAIAIQNNETPYWVLMALAFFAGIGGGAFSGFMPSTSYFFPRRLQGTALGLQAGIGNFGVSLVQFLTPVVVGVGIVGSSQVFTDPATGDTKEVWYQNAALVYIPLVLIAVVLAWTMLKSVPVTANFRQQMDIYSNQDTWWMTYLYVMTFGTFAGLSAQFGLLLKNLYGAGNTAIVETLRWVDPAADRGLHRAQPDQVRLAGPVDRCGRPRGVQPADRQDGRCDLDADLRHRPGRRRSPTR